jgi:hypothetical protein
MKPIAKWSKRVVLSPMAGNNHPTRRGVLRSMVAGLSAYATSFFVSNAAMAIPCSAMDCFGNQLEESECVQCHNQCDPPTSGPGGYLYDVFTGARNENSPCCEEFHGEQRNCLYFAPLPMCGGPCA